MAEDDDIELGQYLFRGRPGCWPDTSSGIPVAQPTLGRGRDDRAWTAAKVTVPPSEYEPSRCTSRVTCPMAKNSGVRLSCMGWIIDIITHENASRCTMSHRDAF